MPDSVAAEERRRTAFDRYRILDTDPEHAFDEVAALAQRLCGTRMAAISLVTDDRQWFKAGVGLGVTETPRTQSFCAHAMQRPMLMTVPDALEDPRFRDNPLVTGDPHIRFYAGAPLITSDGVPLGALCVLDDQPRDALTGDQAFTLMVLARQIMNQLELRHLAAERAAAGEARDKAEARQKRTATALQDSEARFRVLADSMPQMVWATQPDGFHDYYNARWYEFTGATPGQTDGEGWNGQFHPEDQERAWTRWRHSLATGEPYEIEYRLRHHSGQYRWTLGRALPLRDEGGQITRWFGTCTDIHEAKLAAEQRELLAHELSHRIKNIFSVLSGLISLSVRTFPESAGFADALRQRVQALGRAHDFVRPHSERSRPQALDVTLHGMLFALFEAYDQARLTVTGDDVVVDDRAATPLALLFHELATNAAKYGALSTPQGRVSISCRRDGDDYEMVWTEQGGPPVSPPTHRGFGSTLAERSVEQQLQGELELEWPPEGLRATARCPVAAFARPAIGETRAPL